MAELLKVLDGNTIPLLIRVYKKVEGNNREALPLDEVKNLKLRLVRREDDFVVDLVPHLRNVNEIYVRLFDQTPPPPRPRSDMRPPVPEDGPPIPFRNIFPPERVNGYKDSVRGTWGIELSGVYGTYKMRSLELRRIRVVHHNAEGNVTFTEIDGEDVVPIDMTIQLFSGAAYIVDDEILENSENPVAGGALYEAMQRHRETLQDAVNEAVELMDAMDAGETSRETAEQLRKNAETAREGAEAQRAANEIARQNDFETAEVARQTAFQASEAERITTFQASEEARQAAFETSEAGRTSEFNTNEAARQAAIDEKLAQIEAIEFDSKPKPGSNKAVESNGVHAATNVKSSREINLSSLTVYTRDISGEAKWISYTATGYKGVFVKVFGGCEYIIANGSNNSYCHYAFLTDDTNTVDTTPSFATGVTGRSYVLAGSTKSIVAPVDAKYLFITTETNSGSTNISITENYYKKITELASDLLDIAKDNADEIELSTIDFFLKDDGTFGTNASYKHYCVSVNEGERYIITAPSSTYMTYAFATSNSVTSGGTVPVVNGTSVYSVAAGSCKTVVIPNGCSYLLSSSPDVKIVKALDNEPKKGSDRAVKSDGIHKVTFKEFERIFYLSALSLNTRDINTSGKWAGSTSNDFKGVYVPITGGGKYVITNNGNYYNSHYAFLTATTYSNGGTPSYATGVSGRSTLNYGDSIEVTAPSDATYLFITIKAGDTDMGISIVQKIYKKIADIASDAFSIVSDGATDVGFTVVDYSLLDAGTFGGSSNWKHLCVEVNPGKKYLLTAPKNYVLKYAFATSASATANGVVPLVSETSVQTIEASTYKYIEIPSGCSYLLLYKAGVPSGGDFTSDVGIKMAKSYVTISPLMTYDFLRYSNGEFSTHTNIANLRTSVTPRFIKTREPFSITSNADGSYLLFYYSSDFSFIGKDANSNAITANAPQVVTFSYDCSYVKILFTSANEGDTYIPQIKLRGAFPNDWDTFNPRPNDDGYHRISVIVNVTNPTCCDTETSDGTVNDSPELLPDYGVICLPPTYTNTGTPTRLIIYCHGAAVNYADNVTRFNTQDLEPEYWLAEGYAVMDIEGNPFDNSNEHICMPQAMDSYVAGYKWAIEHYNLKRDGVFLGGRSMGGLNTFNLIRRECPIPVIAACPNAAARQFVIASSVERKTFTYSHMGFVTPDGFSWKEGYPDAAEIEVLKDNFDKLIKNDPIWAIVVNLTSITGYEVVKDGNPSQSLIDGAIQANATIPTNSGYYTVQEFGEAMATNNISELSIINSLPIGGSVSFKYEVSSTVTVWTFTRCSYKDILLHKLTGSEFTAIAQNLQAIVKCPVKLFGCNQDESCPPAFTAYMYYRMLNNSGQIAEVRIFDSLKDYHGAGTTAHHYDTQDENLRATVITKYGEELINIPVVYIEMLQFWRRYEQNL